MGGAVCFSLSDSSTRRLSHEADDALPTNHLTLFSSPLLLLFNLPRVLLLPFFSRKLHNLTLFSPLIILLTYPPPLPPHFPLFLTFPPFPIFSIFPSPLSTRPYFHPSFLPYLRLLLLYVYPSLPFYSSLIFPFFLSLYPPSLLLIKSLHFLLHFIIFRHSPPP